MRLSLLLSTACGLLIGRTLATTSMVCNADNCLRAVRVSSFSAVHGTTDCSSYFLKTVTPATTTITVTATLYSPQTAISVVTATSTLDVTVVSTDDITATTTTTIVGLTLTLPPTTVTVGGGSPMFKREGDLAARQVTVVPSSIPTYASACSGSVRYSSACSCIGVTASTTTAPSPSTTVTVTATYAPTITTETTTDSTFVVTTTDSTSMFTTTDATVTVLETTTATYTPPAATYYEACAPENLIGSYNGIGITVAIPKFSSSTPPYTSAYDCCVACLLTPGCAATSSYGPYDVCYLFNDGGTCATNNVVGTFYTDPSIEPGGGYILSNSMCGFIQYGGEE
ncbi:MAG: hypothetical protein MMC33_004088 [Icmadophila ericetorum]|nr:hypothetical protein [Icmadophila ericetorum]